MNPDTLISDNLTLLSMPEIVIKLNSMLDDPGCSVTEIANEISLDPALTVRVLKIVNSAIYNLPNQIKNIPNAITILGIKQIRDIVLTTSVIKKFNSIPADLVNMDNFWHHSISSAITSRLIANHCQFTYPEDYFVMGLLHDIGKLTMYLILPDQSRKVLREIRRQKDKTSDADISMVEKNIFGFSHATIGRVLTQQWNMSESLTTPIAEHHLAYEKLSEVKTTSVLKVSDYISNQIQPSISPDEDQDIDPDCLDILELDENTLEEIKEQSKKILDETLSLVYS